MRVGGLDVGCALRLQAWGGQVELEVVSLAEFDEPALGGFEILGFAHAHCNFSYLFLVS